MMPPKRARTPTPIAQGNRKTNKCFSCWTRPGLLLSRMNHDRRHASYGRAQRAENIGYNLAEREQLHDEGFVEGLRAVPSEAWPKPSVSSAATSPRRGRTGCRREIWTGSLSMGGPEGSTTNEFRGPNEVVEKHLGAEQIIFGGRSPLPT